jgi:hypothetical protein
MIRVGTSARVVATAFLFGILIQGPASASAAPATVLVASLTQATPAPHPVVGPVIMNLWKNVVQCEHAGNWIFAGSYYDGGLGITPWNWSYYGGKQFALAAHLATPDEQVIVARRIQAAAGVPDYVPDQNGYCRGW